MSYSVNNTITTLEERFSDITFNFKSIEFGGIIPVFFIYPKNEKILERRWEEVADFIAIDFQTRQTEEYQVWNIYLFYVAITPVKKELKYKIENDTFSSRKIVIEYTREEDKMIEEYILNNISIKLKNDEESSNDFKPNQIIESLLKDKTLKKKNITKEASITYENLIKILKTSENEV